MLHFATFFKIGCLLLSSAVNIEGGVTISPSSEDAVICAEDTASFTCTLESVVALQWVAEPFITRGGITAQQVSLTLSDVGITHIVEFNGVTFHAVLTQSEPVQGSSTSYTLQSTLTTTASTSTNGTVIECIEPITGASDSSVLQLQIPPPPPTNIYYSVTFYGTSEVTGDIDWNSSMNSSVDNFSISVSSLNGTTDLGSVASFQLKHVTLNYNTNYTISVRASNCAGSSIPGVILFMESGCPPPDQPLSGSVSGFTSAKVGSEVTYLCDEGLNLVGGRVAVCTLHLVWDPMGSEVMCAPPPPGDCGNFGALANGTFILFFNGTADGSVIVFQCAPGFFLVGGSVSQCRSGQWTVQPQDMQCTSHPPLSPETTLMSTPTMTQILISKHPVSQCTQECGTAVAVGITGVVCTVVSLTVGALFGALFLHLITRAQCKSQSQSQTQKPVPMYEDVENITSTPAASAGIELKSNEAYLPLRKQQISSTPNEAYEHVHT